MWRKVKRAICALVIGMSFFGVARGQMAGSPYTVAGVGALDNQETTYNTLKGGVGLSTGNPYVLNQLNPALLSLNAFTIFDFGIQFEQRTLSTDSASSTGKGGGLNYLAFAFPIKNRKAAASISLLPYSTVRYNSKSIQPVENDTLYVLQRFSGEGGINQLMLQTGFRPIESLMLGVKLAYLFGTRIDESTIEHGLSGFNNSGLFRTTRQRGFMLGFGAVYRKKIKEQTHLSVGIIYDLNTDLSTEKSEWLENKTSIEESDTINIVLDKVGGTLSLPQKFGVGISIDKEFKYSFSVDYYQQNWAEYSNSFEEQNILNKAFKFAVGGEFTPNFYSVNNYMARITYLAGFNFSKTPLTIEDEDINEFGINFGVSMPITNGSTVNLGFTWGQLGTTSKNLVKEDFFRVSLGISFNDQAYGWYRKQRKLN